MTSSHSSMDGGDPSKAEPAVDFWSSTQDEETRTAAVAESPDNVGGPRMDALTLFPLDEFEQAPPPNDEDGIRCDPANVPALERIDDRAA